jgi:predicted methyltransferase
MMTRSGALLACVVAVFAVGASCARNKPPQSQSARPPKVQHVAHPGVTPYIRSVVFESGRPAADRSLDAGRHADELLAFFEIAPGMNVGEICAGGGYTTELVARALGDSGRVFAQNNRLVLQRFAALPWSERLRGSAMRKVVRVDRELDDPFPAEARNLDAVYNVLFYHDTVWMGADRDRMNRAIFAVLRPGGFYYVVDHSARAGSGTADAQTLHRIDEAFVIAEIERAGFRLQAVGDFLRNVADKRDWNPSPRTAGERRGSSDRFALQFVKPR